MISTIVVWLFSLCLSRSHSHPIGTSRYWSTRRRLVFRR